MTINDSELLKTIIKKLVPDPESVNITQSDEDSYTIFHIKTANEDISKIIGKNGSTIKALNDLLFLYHQKNNPQYKKFVLKVE